MKLDERDACDPDRIEAYLADAMDRDEEASMVQHLEWCVDCRARMDRVAAAEETWDSARTYLIDDDHDSVQLSGLLDSDTARDSCTWEPCSSDAQVTSVLGTLSPTDDPQMLGRLGPYEVSGVIGAGGMGVVLKGQDPALDRVVAIKILAPHLATSGAARRRFAREAKAAAAVLHPNVMPIHGVMNGGPLPYLVMPYMRGASLQKRIDDSGPLAPIEILRVGSQIASGLAAAHTLGLVHRDIKPANIMLADGLEQVAITDFGLARAVDDATMTRSGVIAGTPQYMSPEQACGEAIDARSDLFSLGSLIYAMCTGRSPFRAETSFGVLRRITDESPRPIREINSEIPAWLCHLVNRLHEKNPQTRMQSAREVEQFLNQCMAHLEQPGSCNLPATLLADEREDPGKPAKTRQGLAAIVGVILVAILLSVVPLPRGVREMGPDSAFQIEPPLEDEMEIVEEAPVSEQRSEAIQVPKSFESLWAELDEDLESLDESIPQIDLLEAELNSVVPNLNPMDRPFTPGEE
ncbi:MAG: protein kinase [Planctomycetota bacterium]